MPAIALNFTTETERQDIVGAASAARGRTLWERLQPRMKPTFFVGIACSYAK